MIYLFGFLSLTLLGLYVLFVGRRAARQSRFQARLTLLFILFVIVPTLLLTIFMSYVLTRSSEMLMQPGVDRALRYSLEVLHEQMDRRGEAAWNQVSAHGDPATVQLRRAGLRYYARIALRNDRAVLRRLVLADSLARPPLLSLADEPVAQWRERHRHGFMRSDAAEPCYEYFRLLNDSMLVMVAMDAPANLLQAKNQLEKSLSGYATLRLLRDSFVNQGLVWGAAILLVLLLSGFAVLAARRISHGISQPIQALTQAMRLIGAGDLSQRVRAQAKDEIQFLITSFNRMAEDLQISRESLQRAERAAAWRDAARQVSHEIKNPLTPIQLSLFRLRSVLPPQLLEGNDLKETFRIIEEELAAMRRLADEFSEFARMPALQFHPASLPDLAAEAARLAETAHPELHFDLQLDPVPEMPIDVEQFRAALYNLLKNAAEASSAGDRILICLRSHPDPQTRIRLEVQDHGHGMDETTLQKAAQPYFTTKKQGTGLGLLIVKRIMQEHGGTLKITSEPGRGTTVTIEW